MVYQVFSISSSSGSKARKPKCWSSIKAQWWFLLFCSSLSAIYRVGLSGSIVVLICFQSSSSAPFLKSKIDMFSAAVPPPLCFSSVWDWSRSIAETCFTSCCAAYNYRAWISSRDYSWKNLLSLSVSVCVSRNMASIQYEDFISQLRYNIHAAKLHFFCARLVKSSNPILKRCSAVSVAKVAWIVVWNNHSSSELSSGAAIYGRTQKHIVLWSLLHSHTDAGGSLSSSPLPFSLNRLQVDREVYRAVSVGGSRRPTVIVAPKTRQHIFLWTSSL